MPTETINITGSNVTASQDTNVKVSLGGTPVGASLEPFSINISWDGVLSIARGGTGLGSLGAALQLIRTNIAANGLEYFTASTTDIPEGANLYFTLSRVLNTVLTGFSISGSSIVSTDTVLEALGKAQNQINSLVGGVNYQGVWNATTNSPALASRVGTKGYYYIVDIPGATNLDGITDWKLGDWAIFNGATWQKVDNTDAVISVNGYIGAVVLTKADLGLGNVDNTSDANKPVSTAQQTALNLKEDLTNKSTNVNTDQASDSKYPSVKSVYDWAVALFATATNTLTFTNKRITKRVTTVSDATSITPNTDNCDIIYQANTQAVGTLTINADTGTPTNCQSLLIIIKSTNVQTFSWNAQFVGGTTALPTATTGATKRDKYAFLYSTVSNKWELSGTALGYI